MKTYREIPRALNVPITIYGVPPFAIAAACMAYAVLMLTPLSKLACAGVCLLVMVGIKLLIAKDERFPLIFWKALWQKAEYTPKRRDVFRMEIK